MEFKVSLDQFEGPLDLMLHLVMKNKLDLFDLNLDILASQYLQYIQQASSLSLEISSEYLVECAALMEYKSRRLLPKKEIEEEDNFEEDQRALLQARLLEYQRCKEQAAALAAMHEERIQHMDRDPASLIEEWSKPVTETEFHESPAVLARAMNRLLKRQRILSPWQTMVEVKEISVEQRMEELQAMDSITDQAIAFFDLFTEQDSLHLMIVTFLAVLELVHSGIFEAREDEEGVVWIRRRNS